MRRTNLALLVLLAVALGTGALAFAVGTGWNVWIVLVHGVVGLAIVGLAPWKQAIARGGVRRRRGGWSASLVLSGLVAAALVFGVLHGFGLRVLGPLTSMQLHVGAALVAVPFAVWHVVARRIRPRRTDLSRRNLLRSGVLLGGAGLVWAGAEGLKDTAGLPGGDRRHTGSHEVGSFAPDEMPVTQWLDDRVPEIDPDAWRLRIRTRDEAEDVGYAELDGFDDRLEATIDCTGGWYATQGWTGARLDRLLPEGADGRSVRVVSRTGYARRFPLRDAPDLLLATRVGDEPLGAGHGFPARLVAPGRRGFWWVKWVDEIAVDDVPWWAQPPFPLT